MKYLGNLDNFLASEVAKAHKKDIEKYEQKYGSLHGKSVKDTVWYKEYVSQFDISGISLNVPKATKLSETDYALFLQLTAASFNVKYEVIAAKGKSKRIEVILRGEEKGKSFSKKLTELRDFQIYIFCFAYIVEQLNFQEGLDTNEAIKEVRRLKLQEWFYKKIKLSYDSPTENSSRNIKRVLSQVLDSSEAQTVERNLRNPYKLNYALTKFEIEGFKGIKSTSFSLAEGGDIPQWIFLVGENGTGKTSVLQAITIGLFGKNDGAESLLYPFENASIKAEYKAENTIKLNDIEGSFTSLQTKMACYGPSRLNPDRRTVKKDNEKSTTTYSLFNNDGLLKILESEMAILAMQSDERKKIYDKIKRVLMQAIPYLADIVVESNGGVHYIEQDEDGQHFAKVPFGYLASGFKSTILLISDIIWRIWFNMESNEISDTEGIVIIDELDLHWHPKMQRELLRVLSEIFPKVQFIASTHSLVPLLGGPENSVLLKVKNTANEGVRVEQMPIDFQALAADELLRTVFDLENYMSDAKQKAWKRFVKLVSLAKFEEDADKKNNYWIELGKLADQYQFNYEKTN